MTMGIKKVSALGVAAKQALEVLEDVPYMSNKDDHVRLGEAITALRAALAEPERQAKPMTRTEMSAWVKDTWEKCQAEAWQEPVAHTHEWFRTGAMEPGQMRCIHCGMWNHEAAPIPRKPLTDEEVDQVLERHAGGAVWSDAEYRSAYALARAIEAAHGIGEQT